MVVLISGKISSSLRGFLTRWMIELRAGVFVSTLSRRVQDILWDYIKKKIKDGYAFLLFPAANEQHFQILSTGKINREVIDYEGIQLLRIPKKVSSNKSPQKKPKQQEKSEKQKPLCIKGVNLSLSPNFIFRQFKGVKEKKEGTIKLNYFGKSAYGPISDAEIWDIAYLEDIKSSSRLIFNKSESIIRKMKEFHQQKISCIDIETTDWIPKAREGYINIIGLSELILRENEKHDNYLILKGSQVFNMTRKRTLVPEMIKLISEQIINADVLLVFNEDFDIKIINHVVKTDGIDFSFPKNIVDLNDEFRSLKELESHLNKRLKFKRVKSKKGNYSAYYKLFKGIGTKGSKKCLEPIGIYNIMDCISPLLYYIQKNY
ncbi:MAG: type I-E CRISPR-associated endoribonuclease Cas2 [Candidatus Lokiarchaeota archaeon]|nr:type I-E CRISPR-associated endoribonuclease Cas2 [Candidatus Lokiarchaeota archaeon]